MVFEYYDGTNWMELNSQAGDGADMDVYEMVTIELPAEALHVGFSLRISSTGTLHDVQKYDDWFVDDIKIEVTEEQEDDNIV